MHMLCKKTLKLRWIGYFAKIQEPLLWCLQPMSEVHTNEEAQVYVHDLIPFVTVQLLEQTPAVLSLGKYCEDHGYSYQWVSGQKPRLTKGRKTSICKTDNFVPLVVPKLSTSSGGNSSSTSSLQDFVFNKSKEKVKRAWVHEKWTLWCLLQD